MIKCNLIDIKTVFRSYNGESYMRANLKFSIIYLGFYKTTKSITYDVTMLENYKEHLDYWNEILNSKTNVSKSIIKNRVIF